jgi:hypothetical protein
MTTNWIFWLVLGIAIGFVGGMITAYVVFGTIKGSSSG